MLAGTFLWSKAATALAALGVILAAAYILWLMQRVVFGTPSPTHRAHLLDLNASETATLVPLVVLVFIIGIFPNPLLTRMHASVTHLLAAPKTPAFAIDSRGERRAQNRSPLPRLPHRFPTHLLNRPPHDDDSHTRPARDPS